MRSPTCHRGPRRAHPPVPAFHPAPGEAPEQPPRLGCRGSRAWREAFLGHCGSKGRPPTEAPSWRPVLAPGGGRRGKGVLGTVSPASCGDGDGRGVGWAQAEGRPAQPREAHAAAAAAFGMQLRLGLTHRPTPNLNAEPREAPREALGDNPRASTEPSGDRSLGPLTRITHDAPGGPYFWMRCLASRW